MGEQEQSIIDPPDEQLVHPCHSRNNAVARYIDEIIAGEDVESGMNLLVSRYDDPSKLVDVVLGYKEFPEAMGSVAYAILSAPNQEASQSVADACSSDDVKNLTLDQLCQAKTLFQTQLDPGLLKQAKQKCPQLLEVP